MNDQSASIHNYTVDYLVERCPVTGYGPWELQEWGYPSYETAYADLDRIHARMRPAKHRLRIVERQTITMDRVRMDEVTLT